jgi:hypothetical protein
MERPFSIVVPAEYSIPPIVTALATSILLWTTTKKKDFKCRAWGWLQVAWSLSLTKKKQQIFL